MNESENNYHENVYRNFAEGDRIRHRERLQLIRSQFPFIPIVPFGSAVTVKLTANTPTDLIFLPGTMLVKFQSTAPFLMQSVGNASIAATTQNYDGVQTGSQVTPTDFWFYADGIRSVSLISEFDDCFVSAVCIR